MIIRSLVFFLAFGESKKCDRGYEKINGRCVDRNECTEEQDLFSFDSGTCDETRIRQNSNQNFSILINFMI
ncbi:unnamed protein product [Oikopleura dioica]|uniref:Uncharacterized protein n=1 Tax=Oikopleura dioica TaxID=34765 RepID=E4XRP4_OIKDI|nr:unnamed protein product [Oikopleura dioica]